MLLENQKVSLGVIEGAAWESRQFSRADDLEFFVVSISGSTYMVAARSRMEAVNILAETKALGTDAADWTKMDDAMFKEVRSTRRLPDVPLNRKQCLMLCGRESGLVDIMKVVTVSP